MSHNALLEYIRKAKERGANDADISKRLHSGGWYRVDIQDALEFYEKVAMPAVPSATLASARPTVRKTQRAPRWYDPRFVAVASLSFGLGFLLYLWLTRF